MTSFLYIKKLYFFCFVLFCFMLLLTKYKYQDVKMQQSPYLIFKKYELSWNILLSLFILLSLCDESPISIKTSWKKKNAFPRFTGQMAINSIVIYLYWQHVVFVIDKKKPLYLSIYLSIYLFIYLSS